MDKILIVLLVVVGIALSNKNKRTAKRPGRAVRPGEEAAQAPEQKPRPQPVKPAGTAHKSAPVPQKKAAPPAASAPRAEQPVREGESRECAHGVVGGSISEDGRHEGEAIRPRTKQFDPSGSQPAAPRGAARPRLSAKEMQRAVVMAEILKRPCERERRFVGR